MRRVLAAFAAIVILSSTGSFGSTPSASIGLYVDNVHLQNCVSIPWSQQRYTVWSWCWASDDGVQAASFAVIPGGNGSLYRGAVQVNTDIIDHYTGTNFMTGLTFYYKTCQYGWHWIHKEDVTQVFSPAYLKIEGGVLDHAGDVMTCQVNQPWTLFAITTRAYFGNCSPIATEPVTWGAIRSLYSE
ncbi:MAG: hypothetical protein ABR899_09935 [Candidatus Krumholzibacteriaceae bacterium]|jgi:hypothetical protein